MSSADPVNEKLPPLRIVWRNVIVYVLLHLAALYGFFQVPKAHPYTWLFTLALYWVSGTSITAGAHRLWTHRSYQATLPLKIFYVLGNFIALQNDIIEWSRDHRVHHKYSETNADPHNAKRGFFFSHAGWLLVRKHPDVIEKGKKVDISDLLNDPLLRFQRKIYTPAALLMCFVMPTVVPWYFWGESAWVAYFVCGIFRYIFILNLTWCVNSVAHLWGSRPYDKNINPVENWFVILTSYGEGFHNYHHTFPSDYSTSEFGFGRNITTMFIDAMAWLGLASNRRKMSPEAVLNRKQRTGDLSHGH